MKIIKRYLLREFLHPLLYCLFAFAMLFVIFDLFDNFSRFMQNELSKGIIAKYYACYLLPTLEYLTPASLLLATLYTLWRFTKNNELIAMRACGISLYAIMRPFLGVALAFTIGSILLKETISPPATRWYMDIQTNNYQLRETRLVERRPFYIAPYHREWLVEQFDMLKPNILHGVRIKQEREDGTRQYEITAQRAEWLDGVWWFFAPVIQHFSETDHPLGRPEPMAPPPPHSNVAARPDYKEIPSDFVNEIHEWVFLSTAEMIRYLRTHPNLSPDHLARRKTDMHNRIALPWACFVVTLFGIPAGARSGRQSAITGILLAIGLFIGFYGLIQFGLLLGKTEVLPPWLAAWIPNIVFGTTGLLMMKHMR